MDFGDLIEQAKAKFKPKSGVPTDAMDPREQEAYKKAMGGETIDAREQGTPIVERTSQGVTAGPDPNVTGLAKKLMESGRAKTPAEAMAQAQAMLKDRVRTWGQRADGSPKGTGFFGPLVRPDGSLSTELTIGVPINGKETQIPTLVPTLSKEEVNYLLTADPNDPTKIPPSIVQKAIAHAQMRISQGKSVFAQPDDGVVAVPR